jgi:hypothetical protein
LLRYANAPDLPPRFRRSKISLQIFALPREIASNAFHVSSF